MSLFQTVVTGLASFSTDSLVLAAITFGGMVLSVLGAFYLVDAIRFPLELVRRGESLVPLYDEVFVVEWTPWEPVWPRPLSATNIWQSSASSAITAATLAIVVGIGFRRGELGLFIGAALGLGLGLAIVLRRLVHRIAALPGFGHLSEFLGMALYWLSYISAMVVIFLAGLLFFLVSFMLMLLLWLILLPSLVFVVLMRIVLHRPAHAVALVAPFAALAGTLQSRRKPRFQRAQRDPFDDSTGARLERWVSGQFPVLQKFILGIIIGHLYALVGRPLLDQGFGFGSEWWLTVGAIVAFGFGVERIFEVVVQSLFQDTLTGFVDVGPGTLAGLRVGLLTGLTLGTIGGLITKKSGMLHAARQLVHGFAPTDVAVAVTSGIAALLLWLVPNILGFVTSWFVDWFTMRIRHLRAGLGVAGGAVLLVGVGLQLLQYIVIAH